MGFVAASAAGLDQERWNELVCRLEADQAETAPVDDRVRERAGLRNRSAEADVAEVDADLGAVAPGRFRVLEHLGKGGWGTVYKAEQRRPVKRLVALKLINLGVDTPEVVARFESERQALARMDHPHIAKIYEAGSTKSGRPYFIMEFVPGEPITDFADRNRLTIAARLDLFQQVCRAINHAHMKAIIHRDIKAGNVLAWMHDGKPTAKVIDFGIAKALTGDRLTEQTFNSYRGQVLGTYESMSPEQASGSADIDTRTDVYSLGVLLYELLGGTKPLDPKKLTEAADDEVKRIIQQVEPERPSTRLSGLGQEAAKIAISRRSSIVALSRQLRKELEWIPLMALRKERDRRYASPLQLAEDLDNYLEGHRLLAGPESTAYRVRKFVSRNKASLASLAAIFVLLVGGIVATSLLATRANHAEKTVASELIEVSLQKAVNENLATERGKLAQEKGHLAEEKGRLAEENGKLAANRLAMLSIADQQLGHELLEQGREPESLAYEARALRENPSNAGAITDSLFLLNRQQWPRHFLLHKYPIHSMAFSPDGKLLLTSSDDGARLWVVASGKQLGEPIRHGEVVRYAAFSPDGTRLVTASNDRTARVWDVATRRPVGEAMRHKSYVGMAVFSPDGARIVTAAGDQIATAIGDEASTTGKGTAHLWDASTGMPLGEEMQNEADFRSVAFSPDGTRVLTVGEAGPARLWDGLTGQPLGEPMRYNDLIRTAVFSPDGRQIVTASLDRTARLWDGFTGRPLAGPMRHPGYVDAATFNLDGTRVLTACEDNVARMWDVASQKPVVARMPHTLLRMAGFSPDGTRVLTVGMDKAVRVWDGINGDWLELLLRHEANIRFAIFSPDGARIATASTTGAVRLWDLANTNHYIKPIQLEHERNRAVFSPDGTRIVTTGMWSVEGSVVTPATNAAQLWDAATEKPVGQPLSHGDGVVFAVFSPDGRKVVTTSADKTARVWDAMTGNPLTDALRHDGLVYTAGFSPDGERIVTASADKTAQVWDAASGRPLGGRILHAGPVRFAVFSPDGTRIVTTCDTNDTAQLWDPVTGKPIGEPMQSQPKSRSPILAIAFSPDGTRIVTASWDSVARLWDGRTGWPIGEPMRHESPVTCAAFSPDGTRVVTTSYDYTARVWDGRTGKPLGESMHHGNVVFSAAFSSDGTRIVTACEDALARIWDAATGRPLGGPLGGWGQVETAMFSPDGTRLLMTSWNKTARTSGYLHQRSADRKMACRS